MTLEGALLGLVSSMGPVTGYDLTKMFRLSMSHYWHARHGQIYPVLDRLKRRGLVTSRKLIQKDRPNKKLYSITEKGKTELVRWLRTPMKPLQMKHEALLKCRFYSHLPSGEAIKRIREERAYYEALLEMYRGYEREYFGDRRNHADADTMYAYFTLRRGVLFLEESIRWCDWVMAEIERYAKKPRRKRARAAASRRPATAARRS